MRERRRRKKSFFVFRSREIQDFWTFRFSFFTVGGRRGRKRETNKSVTRQIWNNPNGVTDHIFPLALNWKCLSTRREENFFVLSLLPFPLPLFHCQGLLLVQPLLRPPPHSRSSRLFDAKSRFRHKIPQILKRKSRLNKILFSNLANFTPLTTIAATARRHFVPINFSSPDVLFFGGGNRASGLFSSISFSPCRDHLSCLFWIEGRNDDTFVRIGKRGESTLLLSAGATTKPYPHAVLSRTSTFWQTNFTNLQIVTV